MKRFAPPEESTRTRTKAVTDSPQDPKLAPAFGRRGRVKPRVPSTPRTKNLRGRNLDNPRPGTKASKVLAVLRRPQGASLKELLKITGWQAHSMRGFLSGTAIKKMGLKVRSFETEPGERRYAVKP